MPCQLPPGWCGKAYIHNLRALCDEGYDLVVISSSCIVCISIQIYRGRGAACGCLLLGRPTPRTSTHKRTLGLGQRRNCGKLNKRMTRSQFSSGASFRYLCSTEVKRTWSPHWLAGCFAVWNAKAPRSASEHGEEFALVDFSLCTKHAPQFVPSTVAE